MSVFMVSSIRVIKSNDDFITNASTYVRLLSGYGTNTVDEALGAFKKGFIESKYPAEGWELIGSPVVLEITRNFVDTHLECFVEEVKPETIKTTPSYLKLIT